MIDIKFLRENPEVVKENIRAMQTHIIHPAKMADAPALGLGKQGKHFLAKAVMGIVTGHSNITSGLLYNKKKKKRRSICTAVATVLQ